jgi:hypothetical protein
VRETDGTIRLADIVMNAPDERLTGSGQIAFVKDLSLQARPLSMDLQLWVRGPVVKRMSGAGLLSSKKDDRGYTALSQPIHLGGTMGRMDRSQWHDLLLKVVKDSEIQKKNP